MVATEPNKRVLTVLFPKMDLLLDEYVVIALSQFRSAYSAGAYHKISGGFSRLVIILS